LSHAVSSDERYEALAQAPDADLVDLADRILQAGAAVDVVSGPAVVSMPLRLPIPGGGETVVVGHVAFTRCEVTLGAVRGDGIRPGRSLEGTIAAAICDAEVERGGPLANAVLALAHATREHLRDAAEWRGRAAQSTRIEAER
jgi:alpha-D-ribose 1-methylphosphonate 5-triphosphate synthase subunit PhnG